MAVIYSSTKTEFMADVDIATTVEASFVREIGYRPAPAQISAFRNSLPYMRRVMEVPEIPGDVGIAIEYKIPSTSKRIDFIITGKNEDNKPVLVLVELKQWSENISITNMDVATTKRLVEAGRILGITVQDHMIVTRSKYYSFAEKGNLYIFQKK